MKIKRLLSILLLSLMSTFAFSAEYTGKIKGFYINSGQTVLVEFDVPTPDCDNSNGGWAFQFNLNNDVAKSWVSMILMARSQKKEIRVGYVPPVNGSGRCGVSYLYFYDY